MPDDRSDLIALRESFDLESRADLFAASGNFREASRLMKQANVIRRRTLGIGSDPNELRAAARRALEPDNAE